MIKRDKKGALELSIGTIVILVLGVSMLILGIVLVRQIMCGALGLTGDINDKVKGEVNKLFGESSGEVACLGAGEAVKIAPGETNNLYCAIKAPEEAEYSIKVTGASSDSSTLTEDKILAWFIDTEFSQTIAPGDADPKKVLKLRVPDTAPESTITVEIQVRRNTDLISTEILDFKISRTGFITSTLC